VLNVDNIIKSLNILPISE